MRKKPFFNVGLLVLFVMFTSMRLQGAASTLPESGILISPKNTASTFRLHGKLYNTAKVEIVSATDAPSQSGLDKVIRVTNKLKADYPWNLQLQAKTIAAVHRGDTLIGSIWLRGHALEKGGKALVSFGLEKAGPPWTGTGWSTFHVTTRWQRYEVAMSAPVDFDASQMQINVRLGYKPQQIEVGPVKVINYQRQITVLRYQRMIASSKPRREPKMGRGLPFWAPQQTSVPALRQQVSLNGTWGFTPHGKAKNEIPVPEYWDATPGFACEQATYQRTVRVPADWNGQRIYVEFEGVNYIADVYVNEHFLGRHVGGFIAFKFDVTPYVQTGQDFELKVVVGGGLVQPIVDEMDKALWPVGWDGVVSRWGIIFPVWLRAYGQVSIDDAYIKTSFANKSITIDYTVTNTDKRSRQVEIKARAQSVRKVDQPDDGLALQSVKITLNPNDTKVVSVTTPWPDPKLWTPDSPNLYHLVSQVFDGKQVVDQQTQRFGFREIGLEKNYFVLNGQRYNFLGSSMHAHAEGYNGPRYRLMWPDNWGKTIDRLHAMNIRVVRFHQQPVPRWMLDIADEKGMTVVEESAVYARNYLRGISTEAYLKNACTWTRQWVKDRRNHASILQWSAENECGDGVFHLFTNSQMRVLGDTISRLDTTRPIVYEGDHDVAGGPLSYHYPEGGDKINLKGSIYQFTKMVPHDRPVGIGEFIYDYGRDPIRSVMQGTLTRGLRFSGFADIRPYTLTWTLDRQGNPIVSYIRNSLSPIAVFDKAYDDVAIDAILHQKYPILKVGNKVQRTLLVYNDTFDNLPIMVGAALQRDGNVIAQVKQPISVVPGFHREIVCEFTVPENQGDIELVLTAERNGVCLFEEARPFTLQGNVHEAVTPGITLKVTDGKGHQ